MRNRYVWPAIALAAALAFLAVARAQSDRSDSAKANANGAAFDAHDLTGLWNPAPFMQPKGEVNPLDLGGHPNPVGRAVLRRHPERRRLSTRGNWLDLAEHLADTWSSFVAGLPLYDPRMNPADSLYSPTRSPDSGHKIECLLAEWRERDTIARRQADHLDPRSESRQEHKASQ